MYPRDFPNDGNRSINPFSTSGIVRIIMRTYKRAHPERWRDRPFETAATGEARCQCLHDELPSAVFRSRRSQSASKLQGEPNEAEDRHPICLNLVLRSLYTLSGPSLKRAPAPTREYFRSIFGRLNTVHIA